MLNPNIYIVGYMGVGKSTVAKAYGNRNNLTANDLDIIIERKEQCTIREIFEKYGESVFRKIEHEALLESFQFKNQIIATGGGTPMYFNNMELMLQNGIVIYLYLNMGVLYHRLKERKAHRPLIAKVADEDLRSFINNHLNERIPIYEKAHFEIDAYPSIKEICASITSKINSKFTAT